MGSARVMSGLVVAAASAVAVLGFTSESASGLSGTVQFTRHSTFDGDVGGGEFGGEFVTGALTMPAMGAGVQDGSIDFQTFCLELNEHLPYAVYPLFGDVVNFTVNTGAINGGISGQESTNFDPISPQTAYLYTRFWNGTLPDYNYTPGAGRKASAGELQFAIWKLEGEFAPDLSDNGHVQAEAWVDLANANAGSGIGDVRVLNITELDGTLRQDVLVRITQPTDEQDPRTIGFWGNKNGAKLIGEDDLAMLRALCLRNADGTNFDPTTFAQLDTWLQNANATNMAYMLSAQLAAMELNVFNGKVDADAVVYAPGANFTNDNATIQQLMDAADLELCNYPVSTVTGADSARRAYQAALKTALDNGNNNLNFI
jgi:hypothetical protein